MDKGVKRGPCFYSKKMAGLKGERDGKRPQRLAKLRLLLRWFFARFAATEKNPFRDGVNSINHFVKLIVML
jgi:hypothetical protein